MILCGVVSHEILEIIEEIFLKATQMNLITINGPLFDLIRQIGLLLSSLVYVIILFILLLKYRIQIFFIMFYAHFICG